MVRATVRWSVMPIWGFRKNIVEEPAEAEE
jgi:hypothetical protein